MVRSIHVCSCCIDQPRIFTGLVPRHFGSQLPSVNGNSSRQFSSKSHIFDYSLIIPQPNCFSTFQCTDLLKVGFGNWTDFSNSLFFILPWYWCRLMILRLWCSVKAMKTTCGSHLCFSYTGKCVNICMHACVQVSAQACLGWHVCVCVCIQAQ